MLLLILEPLLLWPVSGQDKRFDSPILRSLLLISYGVKVIHERFLALEAPISDLANLLRVELLPFLGVQLLVELQDADGMDEIDESVADVALVLEVNWEVEEVVLFLVCFVDFLQKHLLGVLVGDVLDHDGGPLVLSFSDSL